MYICLDCLNTFANPMKTSETHGFTDGLYEHRSGCPKCSGAYAIVQDCSQCGKYISIDYIELKDGNCVCDDCYVGKSLGGDGV